MSDQTISDDERRARIERAWANLRNAEGALQHNAWGAQHAADRARAELLSLGIDPDE